MIERVLSAAGPPRDRACRPVPGLSARCVHARPTPTGWQPGSGCPMPSNRRPWTRPAPSASPPVQAGIDETFVVVNGDVLTDMDLGALIRFHRTTGAQGSISLYPVDDPSAFGVVPTDDSGRVTAFVEKPPRDQAPTNLINAGTYVLEPAVLDAIASDAGSRSNATRSRPWWSEGRSSPWPTPPTGWTPAPRPPTCGPTSTCSKARRPGPPAPGAPPLSPGVWCTGEPEVAGR